MMESAGPTPIGRTMTNNRRRPRPWRGSERLEDRTLLSVSALFLDATGDLSITSHDDDTIIVRENPTQPGRAQVLAAEPGQAPVPVTSIGSVDAGSIRTITIKGGPGDNHIDLSAVTAQVFNFGGGVEITADGRDGHDTLIASANLDDTLKGGNGNDRIDGGSGRNRLVGGHGRDTIDGHSGGDRIDGDDGDDLIRGRLGNDSIEGGDGDDTIHGGHGADTVLGGDGADLIYGDSVGTADSGADNLAGGNGHDTLIG